ncbi:hypothetical protein ScPMuIL_013594 [Solemya velum]
MTPLQLTAVVLLITGMLLSPVSGAGPVIDCIGHSAFVAANTVNAAMIPKFTVKANANTLAYSSATAAFTVGSTSGLVTTDSTLTTGGSYVLSVGDGTHTTTETITYTIFTDGDDPAIGGTMTASVSKSAAVGTIVATSFTVTDTDTVNGDGFTYELAANTEFEIGLWDGVLKTKASLGAGPYSLALTVKDSKRTNPATATIEVSVTTSGATKTLTTPLSLALCFIALKCIFQL